MRPDKVASRILLILSVVHAAAAAPATIRQRSLEVTKKVTPALEKRANLDDQSSHHFPRMDSNLPSTSGTLPSQDDTSPAPDDPQLHSDSPPELGTPQLHIDHPPTSGTPQLQDDLAPAPGGPPSQEDPLLAYGTPQLHNDLPLTPGAPPSQDDTVPGPGTPHSQDETSLESGPSQLHIDQPPAPGGPPSQEDPLPAHGNPQLHNDQPSTPGAPPSPDDTLPVSGTLQSQDETSPASGDPELHSGPPPELGTLRSHIDRPPTSGTPQLQDDMPGTPPSEDDMSESSASRTPQSEPPRGALVLDDAWRAFIQAANEAVLRGEVPGGETALAEGDMSESSASRTLQYHNDDQPPTRGAFVSEDDQWRTWIQAGLRGESSFEGSPLYLESETSSTTSGGPQLQNDPPRSGISQLPEFDAWYEWYRTFAARPDGPVTLTQGLPFPQNDPPPASGTPQLHDDGSNDFLSWYRRRLRALGALQQLPSPPDFDSETPPPSHSETPPPLHLEAPLPLDSGIPPPSDSQTPPPLDLDAPPPLHSETLQLLESEALPSAPETHTLFNDAMTQKLKNYAVVGAVAGVAVGLAFGVKKLIDDHSHGSQRAGRDLASSGVVGRGASMHPRPPKNPDLRAPAELRNEELRLLSILTHRALERPD